MSAGTAAGWERHPDGQHISILISPRDLDEARAWCAEKCEGDFLIVLGPKIVFERGEDAALATLHWRAEED